jgi:general secretion pathway protein D
MMQLLPSEYRELLPLIKKLDALPLQVLVEVTLAEVTLTDNFNLGFEHALRNNNAATTRSTQAVVYSSLGGSGFAATYNSKNLDTVINSYAEDKLLSILSKPKIVILNNSSGSINVGTQIPIVTSEASSNDISTSTDPSILRNISYRNTGVVISLSPTINSNGILTMNINLQLSEAQLNDTSSIDSPLIINRSLSTTLTLKDSQTVMLGGLISKNNSVTDSGVPYLREIPYIGSIFKSKSKKVVKTELIMLIKPFIIKTPTQMQQNTQKYKSILKLLEKYSLY